MTLITSAVKWQKGQFLVDPDNLSPHEHNKEAELVINREMPISIFTGRMSGGPLSSRERVGMYSRHAGGGRPLSACKATQYGKWSLERGVGRMTDGLCLCVFLEDTGFLPWEQGGQ